MPHLHDDTITRQLLAIGTSGSGIEFGSLDGEPVWFALGPEAGPQVPAARHGSTAVFDEADEGVVLCAGKVDIPVGLDVRNDVWSFCLRD